MDRKKNGSDAFEIFIDDDSIIHTANQRILTPENISVGAKEMARQLEKHALRYGKAPQKMLLDLTGVQMESLLKSREHLNQATRMLREKFEIPKDGIKIAVLGLSRLSSIAASFVFNAAGYLDASKKVRFFSSTEKAMTWLKNDE